MRNYVRLLMKKPELRKGPPRYDYKTDTIYSRNPVEYEHERYHREFYLLEYPFWYAKYQLPLEIFTSFMIALRKLQIKSLELGLNDLDLCIEKFAGKCDRLWERLLKRRNAAENIFRLKSEAYARACTENINDEEIRFLAEHYSSSLKVPDGQLLFEIFYKYYREPFDPMNFLTQF
ncbi:MAG: hypothetical protein GXO63_00305 [Candidatus Micrarchaeota archaeon]|nr:hypothetical protein [Candidatus Micrarchaeota archaeon]